MGWLAWLGNIRTTIASRWFFICIITITAAFGVSTFDKGLAEAGPAKFSQNNPEPDLTEVSENDSHQTPMAGEAYTYSFFGKTINIPARQRENILSLSVGANLYEPEVGDNRAIPIAALYWRHRWQHWWTRNVIGLFVNEIDIARDSGRLQLLGHFENNTVPIADTEIQDGEEVKSSSVIWGTASGWLGGGIRIPVAPYQADNDLRLQLFYHAGYFYNMRTSDTGSNVQLPPDTFIHGLRLRARYDGLRRNFMELPHDGWAAGGDVDLTRRDNWSESTFGDLLYKRNETRDYLKLSAYLVGATAIPWLSERHRFVGYLHGGISPMGKLDRFSAFRAGGGPFPNETDDLYRLPYPGALFNDFPVSDYVVGTLEYRLELLFFMYLHLRGTFAWGANRPDFSGSDGLRLRLNSTDGEAFSAGLTTGFFYDSQLYLEYAYDTKLLRNGTSGNSLMLLWSKSF
jgi:hypothetical protein